MKSLTMIAVLAVTMAAATSAQAAQFVTNGNFTSLTHGVGQLGYNTNATGWSVASGSYNFVMASATAGAPGQYPGGVALWDKANGGANSWNGLAPITGNFAALNGDFDVGALSQTITGLTVGQTYTLSFDYAFSQQTGFSGATSQYLTTTLNGATVDTTPTVVLPSHGFSGWQTYSTTITANAGTEILSFLAHGSPQDPANALVTDVSLTSAVPEPATWAMMIVGLGAMGMVARRRRLVLATA